MRRRGSTCRDYQQETAMCVHCQFGLVPVRLRRRWVHHFPDTGQLIVCEEKNITIKRDA